MLSGDRTDVAESVSHKDRVLNIKAVEALFGQLTPAVQSVSSTVYAASVAATVVLDPSSGQGLNKQSKLAIVNCLNRM